MTGDNFIMPNDAGYIAAPLFPAPHFLTINAGSPEPIVTISPDGTVTVHKAGSEPEAARIFWEAVGMHHQTVVEERDRLKRRVEELESMFAEEIEELNLTRSDT
jgi:hypothetical protein